MLAIENLAISKAIKEAAVKRARAEVAEGTHAVDVSVRVVGTLTVNPDETFIPTAEIPLKATLALFIRRMGVTRDAAMAALVESMTEALERDEKGADKSATILQALEEETIIRDAMAKVHTMLAALPEKTRKGKVLTDLTIEPIGD